LLPLSAVRRKVRAFASFLCGSATISLAAMFSYESRGFLGCNIPARACVLSVLSVAYKFCVHISSSLSVWGFYRLDFSGVVLAAVKVCFGLPFHDVCVLTIPASVFSTGCSCFFFIYSSSLVETG
jgi:hypothetical protein